MKIAIHHRPGSFSEGWITYCQLNNVDYKLVNAFDSNIIDQVKDCDGFLWHHSHAIFEDVLVAKKVLLALDHLGIKTYPNYKTGWHFDDKVAQKYLFEGMNAPSINSYVFYEKKQAIEWIEMTNFPKVFKLKGGAGAINVKLVRNKKEALKLVNKAFSNGFSQFDQMTHFKERFNKFKRGQDSLVGLLKALFRFFIIPEFAKKQSNEKGYIYFQDFIPNNAYDTRVVVIGGERAIAEKRFVRENDFRASGSGIFSFEGINLEVIKKSFEIAKKLELQSVAFDFILDENNKPLVIEMSYGFGTSGIKSVSGYWDDNLTWHKGECKPEQWILESFLKG